MKKRILSAGAIVLMWSACVHAGSCYQRDTFGDAFRAARDNQILYPGSGTDLRAVEGLEGSAAQRAYLKYVNSFKSGSGKGASSGKVQLVPLISSPGGKE